MHTSQCVRLALLLLLGPALALTGCDSGGQAKKAAEAKAKEHDHDHPHEGPHHGALAEGPDESYHAEFTVDHAKKQAVVYILDGKAKDPVPIANEPITLVLTNAKPPTTIKLNPDPQKEDPEGSCSRFSGTDDKLGDKMEFQGEIIAKVKDKQYIFKFEEKEHGHKH